jgi:hypothetical protein
VNGCTLVLAHGVAICGGLAADGVFDLEQCINADRRCAPYSAQDSEWRPLSQQQASKFSPSDLDVTKFDSMQNLIKYSGIKFILYFEKTAGGHTNDAKKSCAKK